MALLADTGNDVLTVDEVARLLRMPPSTIYSLAQEGRMPAFKVGRRWRFRHSALEQWVTDQEQRGIRPRRSGGDPRRKPVMRFVERSMAH